MFVDSHCHLNFPDLIGDLQQVLANMAANRVTHALCIGVERREWPTIIALAEQHANIYASVGVHPDHDGEERREPEPEQAELLRLAAHPKVVGIGETGLDYYRLRGDLEWQRERFRVHIRAARACGKPLIVHTRAAAEDTLRLMREERADAAGGVMHCFTETEAVALAAMELGFHISFSGIITFKNAAALREVVKRVPLDKMLIETDAPYLAPMPYRGKTNQPAYVKHVAEEVARIKAVSLEEVAAVTRRNFFRLFKIAAT